LCQNANETRYIYIDIYICNSRENKADLMLFRVFPIRMSHQTRKTKRKYDDCFFVSPIS